MTPQLITRQCNLILSDSGARCAYEPVPAFRWVFYVQRRRVASIAEGMKAIEKAEKIIVDMGK